MKESGIVLSITVTMASGIWILITYIREQNKYKIDISRDILNRHLEINKILIEYPDIQQYLTSISNQKLEYFRSHEILTKLIFFKAKSLVYMQINLFDEIISINAASNKFLKMVPIIEYSGWESYIKNKLSHPIYISILDNEMDNFGDGINLFWAKYGSEIKKKNIDLWSW